MTRFMYRAAIAATLIAAPVLTLTAAPAFAADGSRSATTTVDSAHQNAATGYAAKKKKKVPTTKPTTKPATPPATSPGSSAGFEAQVVTLTNTERIANGCGALRVDDRLMTAARAHSTDMVTQKYFSHTSSNGSDFVARAKLAGYTGASGENIAWGYRTPQEVVTGWMDSPGHRANILNCASVATGVGVALQSDGTPYWTQVFGRV